MAKTPADMIGGRFSFKEPTMATRSTSKKLAVATGPKDIHVTFNGETKHVFMSYGLLSQLANGFPNPEDIATLHLTPASRTWVLQVCLSKREPNGDILPENMLNTFNLEMEVQEANRLFSFVANHLFDFFLKATEEAVATGEMVKPLVDRLVERTKHLMPTRAGSKA